MNASAREKKWCKDFYKSFKRHFKKTNLSWKTLRHSNAYWTKVMMVKVLGQMAEDYGRVPYSRFHSNYGWGHPEYMVDMCWEKQSKNEFYYYLDVAIEEEWDDMGTDKWDLLKDFCKLIDIKAYLKVFIFSPKRRNVETWIGWFTELIKNHPMKMNDEVYIVLSLTKGKNDYTGVERYIIDKFGNSRRYKKDYC